MDLVDAVIQSWRPLQAAAAARGLAVSNSSGSLTPADVSRFFDRFWRHDASRAGGHAGLGLSLARTFAHAMGGDVRASLDAGRLTVALTLPGVG